MRLRLLFTTAFVLAMVAPRPSLATNDPRLHWKTLETPHFNFTYYEGEDEIAQRMADLAESIYARLSPALGWKPSEKTEIVITDQTDSANAFASALPYNSIHFYATSPDDMSPLADVDDWYETLITHEYTHVLHTDHIRGIPALVNVILGKTIAPNQIQPHWLLEGLAVYEESEKTSGGRLRSPIWNMYMRADVLENNIAPLDVFSNTPRRFPQGNIWYLYGSYFVQWLAETYGQQTIRTLIDDYGRQLIPYGINRALKRVTGRTYEDLYPAWVGTMKREFGAQAERVKARGLREGKQITHHGQSAFNPRWVPANALGPHGDAIIYNREDGHDPNALTLVALDRAPSGEVIRSHDDKKETIARLVGGGTAAFLPDGSLLFDSGEVYQNIFLYNDLSLLPPGERSPSGLEGNRKRLTWGWRATQPAVSPDGRRVCFITSTRGTRYLQIADLQDGKIVGARALVDSAPYELAYSPAFSPDGRLVAYSRWRKGGYRDIHIVDTLTGKVTELTHDRAIDGGPTFTPDGKWLLFHSDRVGGITNIFAWEIGTSNLKQVTNVITGAFQPAVSPDGKTLVYVGFHSGGHDLYAMRFDPSQWLDVPPYIDDRPAPPPEPVHHDWKVREYDPLQTLRPRKYNLNVTTGPFGSEALVVSVDTSDIVGNHLIGVSLANEFDHADLQLDGRYTYARLPFDMSLHGYRAVAPRPGFQLGSSDKPGYTEEAIGGDATVSYPIGGAFDNHALSASYSVARVGVKLPPYSAKLDPYETPNFPNRGQIASVLHLGWSYSNAVRTLWAVGSEDGFSASAGFDLTDAALGSDYSGYRVSANFTKYWRMPWGRFSRHLRHHSLAFHAGGGASGGTMPGAGPFYVGGFVDVNYLDEFRSLLSQGAFVLRGYPPVSSTGHYYGLFNLEYRFPIWNIDRGPSTVPLFFNRLAGAAFVDYGGAFDDFQTAKLKTGVGAELWLEATLGYLATLNFRFGYARGLASGGIDKFYWVSSFPF